MRDVLKKYKTTNDSMKATTINILENIKKAYYKFLKAVKVKSLLDRRPAEMLTVEILRRYKNNIERIKDGESDFKIQVTETAHMLDLLRAFFIINYRKKLTDSKSQGLYRIFIFDKIKKLFHDYEKYLLEIGDQSYNDFKDFTACLLLKMEMRTETIFKTYTIGAYSTMPVSQFKHQFSDSTKIYYELLDSLLILPNQCDNLIKKDLKDCVRDKANQIIVDFY